MPWYEFAVRGLIVASALLVVSHFMGKRIVGELSVIDFIVGITIGSIAGMATLDIKVPLWGALSSLAVWAGFQWANVLLGRHSRWFRLVAGEEPTVLVRNGKIEPQGLQRSNMSESTLLSELRARKVVDLADVEVATLESSGKLGLKLGQPSSQAQRQPTFPKAPPPD